MANQNNYPKNVNETIDMIPTQLNEDMIADATAQIINAQEQGKAIRENTNHLIDLEKKASAMDENEQFAMAKHFDVAVLADAIKWISQNRETSLYQISENIKHLEDVLKGRA